MMPRLTLREELEDAIRLRDGLHDGTVHPAEILGAGAPGSDLAEQAADAVEERIGALRSRLAAEETLELVTS